MAGVASWQAKIEIDIKDLQNQLKSAESNIDKITNEPRTIELGIDTKTLESAISKLDKMLTSLGKGTGDFKQFETLSSEISEIKSNISELSKSLGNINDSGAKNVLLSFKEVNNVLDDLNKNISGINKSFKKINIGSNVKQEITDVAKFAESFGEKTAKNLISEFNVTDEKLKEKVKSLSKSMMGIYSSQGYTDEFKNTMSNLVQAVVSGANVIRERTGIYDEFYDTLKKLGTIKISDTIKNDLGDDWNTLRQLYPNKFSTSKGIEMDSIYQEFSSKFKDLFSGQSNPTEQFLELCKAIQLYRTDVDKLEPIDPKDIGFQDSVWGRIIDETSLYRNAEKEQMSSVSKFATEAANSKNDFANANERVQSSIATSEGPLKTEADLMAKIAKSAHEAADAKKEFVEANEQVKASADDSKSENKKNRYKNKKKVSEEEFLKDAVKYSSAANEKLSSSGYSILGGSVDSSLITDGLAQGLVKVSAKVKDADGVWRSFSAKVDADGNVIDERFRTITKNVANLNYQLSNYGKDHVRIQETEDQIKEGEKLSEVMSRYETIRKRIATGKAYKTDEEEAQSLLATIEKIMGIADGSVTILSEHQLAEAQSRLEKINTIVSDLYQKNISNRINQLTPYDKKLSGYNATLDRFKAQGWASPDYTKNVQAVSDALSNYSNELQRLHSNPELIDREALSGLDDFKKKLDSAIMSVNNMTSAEKGFTALTQQKALRNINQILESNSKMSSQAKAKIRAYYNEIKSGNPSASLDVLLSKIQEIANAEIAAGRGGKSLFAAVKEKAFYGLANTIGTFFGLNDLIQYGKQAANIVTDLNTQITELAKVSEQTSSQIYKDFKSYSDIAQNMGATISDTISATADWSRNGYNIPDAKELAEVALLYKNVGDGIDITEANESLISTLKGFKLEADQAEHIIDVFNEVSNNEAIASSGIGAALQRSAASFNAANTSLEKSVALVTATNSVIQDPEKVGNMWKTNLLSLCTEMCA